MDLLQLRYFQAVARLEHMTRVADALHIAQPSLSKTIARLEADLGVPLFDRQGRQICLNRFGQAFLRHANRILREVDDAQLELADMAGLEHGLVTVGTTTARLLPNLLQGYLALHPQVNVRILQISAAEAQHRLMSGNIDLCVSSPVEPQPGICMMPLLTEELFLAVPPHHRFAGSRCVRLRDVASEAFISTTADYALRQMTEQLCKDAGFKPNVLFEIGDPDVILHLIRAGLGIALIPAYWLPNDGTPAPVRLRVDAANCSREIGVSWREDGYLSAAVVDFREYMVGYFAGLSARSADGE